MAFGDWLGGFFGGGDSGLGGGAMPEQLSGPGMPEVAPGAGSGGGSFWDSLSGGLQSAGSLAKAALPVAQLGTTGLGIWGGINQMQQGKEQMGILRQQQKAQQQMAAPAAASGGALTAAGSAALTGGALPAPLEAQVEDFKNNARMRYRQQLAAQGITDSSIANQYESWVELQAQKLRGELAGNLYGQGLQGIGTAMGPSSQVSQTAMGMAKGTAGSLEGANAALARLLGSQ
jgi:hypothetical protein